MTGVMTAFGSFSNGVASVRCVVLIGTERFSFEMLVVTFNISSAAVLVVENFKIRSSDDTVRVGRSVC